MSNSSERIGHFHQEITLAAGVGVAYINRLPTGVAASTPHGNFIARSTFVKNDGANDMTVTPTPSGANPQVIKAGEVGQFYGNVEQLDIAGTGTEKLRVYAYERSGMRAPTVPAQALTAAQVNTIAKANSKYAEAVIGTPGAEAADVIPVTVTALDDQGVAIPDDSAVFTVEVYDSQYGGTPSSTATIALTGGGDGTILGGSGTASVVAELDAVNGELDLDITETAAASRWLEVREAPHANSKYGPKPARVELPFA